MSRISRHRARQPRFDSGDALLDGAAATLDLHGDTALAARERAVQFIGAKARTAPGSLLHIITGRGKGSPDGARLRPMVAGLLRGGCAHFIKEWDRDTDDGGFRVRLR